MIGLSCHSGSNLADTFVSVHLFKALLICSVFFLMENTVGEVPTVWIYKGSYTPVLTESIKPKAKGGPKVVLKSNRLSKILIFEIS
jgi:hypothetical protein